MAALFGSDSQTYLLLFVHLPCLHYWLVPQLTLPLPTCLLLKQHERWHTIIMPCFALHTALCTFPTQHFLEGDVCIIRVFRSVDAALGRREENQCYFDPLLPAPFDLKSFFPPLLSHIYNII